MPSIPDSPFIQPSQSKPPLVSSLVVAGVAALVFAALAFLVTQGRTDDIDRAIVRSMRSTVDPAVPVGPRWLGEVGRDLTALGGYAVLTLVMVAATGFLVIQRKVHAALFIDGAAIGGLIAMIILKSIIDRPRPDVVPHLSYVNSASFPSGHSMLSAIIYLTLGVLLSRFVEGRRLKGYILMVGMFLTLLVGASRVFMGVHYPSDVIAGWSAGVAWAIPCWLLAGSLQRHKALETDKPEPGADS